MCVSGMFSLVENCICSLCVRVGLFVCFVLEQHMFNSSSNQLKHDMRGVSYHAYLFITNIAAHTQIDRRVLCCLPAIRYDVDIFSLYRSVYKIVYFCVHLYFKLLVFFSCFF